MNSINLIGYAAGVASNNLDCEHGPDYLFKHPEVFASHGLVPNWIQIERIQSAKRGLAVLSDVGLCLQKIALDVIHVASKREPFVVIGGDHSVAMGTWKGMMEYYRNQGELGLIWIDAHMDSHTPESSLTKNPHGMPLSYLLGVWEHEHMSFPYVKSILKPEHICLVGIRSYETPEYNHLKNLGVKIYFMEEVQARGIQEVMAEASQHIRSRVQHVGVSIDLDAMDPYFCPGVGCPEPNGICLADLIDFFKHDEFKNWCGLEIAEFNPLLDKNNLTASAIAALIDAIYF